MLWFIFSFLLGLGVLYLGAEGTIHGAVGIARLMGVSSLMIGLTLVAYGTSAPELAIDLTAAFSGKTELAFGDLIGSNIANLGLILAVSVLIRPLRINSELIRFELPILFAQTILLWVLCWDGRLGRADALILLGSFGATAAWTMWRGLLESRKFKEQIVQHVEAYDTLEAWQGLLEAEQLGENDRTRVPTFEASDVSLHASRESVRSYPMNLAMTCIGLFALIAGAQMMVYGAVAMARVFGISEMTIGLTIVAVGTSLPELATAILASKRKESEIVIGNVAGSNLFNLGCILGLVALISPVLVPQRSIRFELPVLIAFTGFLVPFAFVNAKMQRWLGLAYLMAFLAFLVWQTWPGPIPIATESN